MSPFGKKVPLEVAEHIIDQNKHDRFALQSSALVCRGWLPRSRLHLFRKIEIWSREELNRLLETFRTAPELRAQVQHVATPWERPITVALAAVTVFLSELPNIHTWSLPGAPLISASPESRVLIACLRRYSFLQTLHLHDSHFHSMSRFITFLQGLRGLINLHLNGVSVGDHEWDRNKSCPPIPLASLTVRHCPLRFIAVLLDATHATLQTLTLDGGDVIGDLNKEIEAGSYVSTNSFPFHFPSLHTLSLREYQIGQRKSVLYSVVSLAPLRDKYPAVMTICLEFVLSMPSSFSKLLETEDFRQVCNEIEKIVVQDGTLLPNIVFVLPRASKQMTQRWIAELQALFPNMRERGTLLLDCTIKPTVGHDHTDYLSVSSDGRRVLSVGHSPEFILWDGQSGDIIHQWDLPNAQNQASAFSPDGRFVAIWGSDVWKAGQGYIEIWEILANKAVPVVDLLIGDRTRHRTFSVYRKILWSSNGTIMAYVTSIDRHSLFHVWDSTTYRFMHTSALPNAPIGQWLLSPDGRLAACRLGPFLEVWDILRSQSFRKITADCLRGSSDHRWKACALYFQGFICSPSRVATYCEQCGSLLSWGFPGPDGSMDCRVEIKSGTLDANTPSSLHRLRISSNGEMVACATKTPSGQFKMAIHETLHNAYPGSPQTYTLPKVYSNIKNIHFSARGHWLALPRLRRDALDLWGWNGAEYILVETLKVHETMVRTYEFSENEIVEFSENETVVVCGTVDGTVHIHHLPTCTNVHADSVTDCR